jgi:ADP-heptose:LPS heptosyltransferase
MRSSQKTMPSNDMAREQKTIWYLALRYMTGAGLVVRQAVPVPEGQRGLTFLFVGDVLRDAADWRNLVQDWWAALAPAGYLIFAVSDCRHRGEGAVRVTLGDLTACLNKVQGWRLWEADLIDGTAYVVFQKIGDGQVLTPWAKGPRHALIARTGAHGDALMAASILPALKAEGWTISFLTQKAGAEVLRHDPHIDDLILLRDGQLADDEQPFYWQAWAARVDRFINLTHTVEGELLKQPWRGDYFWSDAQRRALCAQSYLARTHAAANVPPPYHVRFYPSKVEQAWAEETAAALGPFILWSLHGSAVHKWWPFVPQGVCQILARTPHVIILTGDASVRDFEAQILTAVEDWFGDTSRVFSLVGERSLRDVLALADKAALVIGPETAVLNAVSLAPMPKLVFLSHSAPKNLTDDWVNAHPLLPSTPCYPCHRLHYGHDWCPQDKTTGAAACAASISVKTVLQAVLSLLPKP